MQKTLVVEDLIITVTPCSNLRYSNGGTSLTDGYNCLDRVRTYKSHDGVVEESQSTDTPNSEFYNSLKHRVTTADTSIASGQYHALSFRLEGNSVTQLGFTTLLVQKRLQYLFG